MKLVGLVLACSLVLCGCATGPRLSRVDRDEADCQMTAARQAEWLKGGSYSEAPPAANPIDELYRTCMVWRGYEAGTSR